MFFANFRKERELAHKQMLLEIEEEKLKLKDEVVKSALECAKETAELEHAYHSRSAEVKELEARLDVYKQLDDQFKQVMAGNATQYKLVIEQLKSVIESLRSAVVEASRREVAVNVKK